MHAYAAEDPLFLAMNARGQRETDGELGDLCVGCHAPVAVALGETSDGLNLDELDAPLKGVTCFACHQAASVGELHNNGLRLALDNTMRGGISDPQSNTVHDSAWSPLHDRDNPRSSDMCGSCHDVVLPTGIHLERTYLQWSETLYADPDSFARLSCAACHLPGYDGVAVPGGKERRLHDHSMPGVDIALTPFPETTAQRAAVQDELDTALLGQLCASVLPEGTQVLAALDNVAAGHAFPSGAAHDRRLWVELKGFLDGEEVWAVADFADDEIVPPPGVADSSVWQFRDVAHKANDDIAHMFWEVERLEEYTIPGPLTLDPSNPDYAQTHATNIWLVPQEVDRITMRARMRPVGLDVVDDLIASGDLDPAIRDVMPVFDLGATVLEWTPTTATSQYGSFTCVP